MTRQRKLMSMFFIFNSRFTRERKLNSRNHES